MRNLVHPFYVIPEEESEGDPRRGGRVVVRLPEIEPRRPRLPGARVGGAHAHRAALPGVDRAQRLRPGHHAHRALRVDDRDDDVPPQPRAGQDLRPPARAARRADAPGDAGASHACASCSRRRPRSRSRSRPARPRSGRCARPTRNRSSSRSPRAARSSRWRRAAYVVDRDGVRRNIAVDAGVARPVGADRAAFSAVPRAQRRDAPRLRRAAVAAAHARDRRGRARARRRRGPAPPAAALGDVRGRAAHRRPASGSP